MSSIPERIFAPRRCAKIFVTSTRWFLLILTPITSWASTICAATDGNAGGTMPVYASAETMADLERVFEFAFKALNPFPGYLKPEPHIVSGPFQLGLTTITPLPVPHGNFEVNGFLFSRGDVKLVAYLSDCSAVPDEIAQKITGVKSVDHRRVAAQTASDAFECSAGDRGGTARAA